MAGLQDDLDDAVDLVLVDHVADVGQTLRVGAHNRAGDIQMLFGQRVHDRLVLVDLAQLVAQTVARIEADHVCTHLLDRLDDLVAYTGVGAAGDQQTGTAALGALDVLLPAFQYLAGAGFDLIAARFQIEGEGRSVQTGANLVA